MQELPAGRAEKQRNSVTIPLGVLIWLITLRTALVTMEDVTEGTLVGVRMTT